VVLYRWELAPGSFESGEEGETFVAFCAMKQESLCLMNFSFFLSHIVLEK
jgi:hypothetical protein